MLNLDYLNSRKEKHSDIKDALWPDLSQADKNRYWVRLKNRDTVKHVEIEVMCKILECTPNELLTI